MARSQMPDKKLRVVRERPAYRLVEIKGWRTKGQLKAKYGDQQKVWRIVYVANGLWQLQQFNPPEGVSSGWGTREQCWWRNHQRPTDYETAFSQLKRRDNMQQASA